jgi:hypothetical protein
MNTIPIRPFAATKLLAFAFLALGGCHIVGIRGNGNITTENRPVAEFTSVEADGAFEIQWSSGPAACSITTDQNLLSHIETTSNGKTLRIHSNGQLRPTKGNKVKVSSATLTSAGLTGAVRFAATKISGKGFYLEGTGATRVNIDGNVGELIASMTGASRLDAEELQTQTAQLTIAGAGRADVTVANSLKVEISGAGKVTYAGNPTIEKDISGAGSIKQR